jgi:L-threonylcarbamoyladenylate synthase
MIVPATAENIARAASALAAGELVAFPTETVYGLGANARDGAAIGHLFTTKGRPAEHPVIVHLAGADALRAGRAVRPGPSAGEAFWPGR